MKLSREEKSSRTKLIANLYSAVTDCINHGITLKDILILLIGLCNAANRNNPGWRWDYDAESIDMIIGRIQN